MWQKWLRALWLAIADAFDDLFLFPTSLDRQNVRLCEAIAARLPVQFSYRGGERTVEPFCLGLVHRGGRRNISLLCYQTGGHAELVGVEGWKLYRAREIQDLAVGREPFVGARPGYDPDDVPMYRVYCRAVPARKWSGPAARSIEELVRGVDDEAVREKLRLTHDELMHIFRRMHPEAVPDLDDLGELAERPPQNEEPAPRNVAPAPDNPLQEKPSD